MSQANDIGSTTGIALALAALLVFSAGMADVAATGPGSDAQTMTEDAFVVTVHADGDAEVSLVTAFDLTADAEKRAFRQYRDNETKRQHLRERLAGDLRNVVAEVDDRTERDMGVADPTVTATTSDDGTTGVVAMSITWTNLAAERDGALVVEEPFASGFATERTFVLRTPDGYAFADVTPSPATTSDGVATWTTNSSLDGFRAVVEPTGTDGDAETPTSDETANGASGSTPGFDVVGALAALVAGAAFAARR